MLTYRAEIGGEVGEFTSDAFGTMDALAGTDYLKSPLPRGEDDDIAALLERFANGDHEYRLGLSRRLTRRHFEVLGVFAVRMASLAVVEGSVPRLRHGLLALALASGVPASDWRDLALQFGPLEDAGRRIGSPAGLAFTEAARLASGPVSGTIRGASPSRFFLLRWLRRLRLPIPEVQTWAIVQTANGMRYQPRPEYTEASILQQVARGQIEYLVKSLEAYRRDHGAYPTTEQGLLALWKLPDAGRAEKWKGPYLKREPPRDPWGRPFVYKSPRQNNVDSYDLLSYGADGKPGGEDDAADISA